MRRTLFPLFLLTLLTACTRASDLPSEVVMERTVIANRAVESAHVEGAVLFQRMPFVPINIEEGTVRFEGDMQDGGRQLALALQLSGSMPGDTPQPILADGEMIVLDGREVYVRLNQLTLSEDIPEDDSLRQLSSSLAGTWWSLAPVSFMEETSITPDPQFLRMQSEAVEVVRDNGIKRFNGRDVHLFDVRMDPVKLQTFLSAAQTGSGTLAGQSASESTIPADSTEANGSLWIDAETYLLHRARWTVRQQDGSSAELTITFSEHQKPVTISPPQDALPFPSNATDLLELLQKQEPAESATMIITD